MAHYRKHRTSGKKGGRRYENKQQRASERQSLSGGHSKLVRSGGWSHRPQPPLVLAERDQTNAAVPTHPKERKDRSCPVRRGNKRHHFLRDQRSSEYWKIKAVDHWTWVRTEERAHYIEHYKLCAYCGLEEVFRTEIKVNKQRPATRERPL